MGLSKLFENNWVVTLTATLIGVFAALYLNEWMSGKKQRDQKEIATQNVLSEISSNHEKLSVAAERHRDMVGILNFLNDHSDDESSLVASPDSMQVFQQKFPGTIMVEDSTLVSEGMYRYSADVNLGFSLPQHEISTIAWRTLKSSGIGPDFEFECLMFLEGLYNLTDEVIGQNKVFLEYMTGDRDMGDKAINLLKHLRLLVEYEVTLSEMLEAGKVQIGKCG